MINTRRFCILITLFLICGCATVNYGKYEEGKLYYENGKTYNIVTNPDFISWRKNYQNFRSMDKNEPMSGFDEIVGYRFHNWRARPMQYLKASLYRVDQSEENIDPLTFKLLYNVIENGDIKKNHIHFKYCIYASRNSSGYTYLNKILAKKVDKKDGHIVWIVYSEDISYNEKLRYYLEDWNYPDKYSQKQKVIYNKFLTNAENNFNIIPD